MKIGLSLKLGIVVVVLFGMLFAGMILYKPIKYGWLESRLQLPDGSARERAIRTLVADGAQAREHMRKWLDSDNERLFDGACRALARTKGGKWEEYLPRLESVLGGRPSDFTDSAAKVLLAHDFPWKQKYKPDANYGAPFPILLRRYQTDLSDEKDRIPNARRRNIFCHLLVNSKDRDTRIRAAKALGTNTASGDLSLLFELLPSGSSPFVGGVARAGVSGSAEEEREPWKYDVVEEKSAPRLVRAVTTDASLEVRAWSALALGALGEKTAVKALTGMLAKELDPLGRLAAAKALGDIGDNGAITALSHALRSDGDEKVRAWYANSLGKIADPSAVKPLIAALEKDTFAGARFKAAAALTAFHVGEAAAAFMKAVKNDSNEDVRELAAQALGEMGAQEAFELLLDQLEKTGIWSLRSACACALGDLGDKRAIEPLLDTVKTERKTKYYFDQSGHYSRQDLFGMVFLVFSERDHPCPAAIRALGKIGDKRALDPLVEVLNDMEADFTPGAYWGGRIMGGGNINPEGAIVAAMYAIADIGGPKARDTLLKVLEKFDSEWIKGTTIMALARTRDPEVAGKIIPYLTVTGADRNQQTRTPAIMALGMLGDNRAVETLVDMLGDESLDSVYQRPTGNGSMTTHRSAPVRIQVASALGKIGDRRAVDSLLAALKHDKAPEVRQRAAEALANFDDPRIDEAYENAMKKKQDPGLDNYIAWRKGVEYLKDTGKGEIEFTLNPSYPSGSFNLHELIRARWGNASALHSVLATNQTLMQPSGPVYGPMYNFVFFYNNVNLEPFLKDVLSRMPEGCPRFDFRDNYAARKKQVKAIPAWLEKHEHRIAWNAGKRKYYLKAGK